METEAAEESSLQLEELLTGLPALVCRLTGAAACTLYTIEPSTGALRAAASTTLVWDFAFKPDNGLPGKVAALGEAIFLDAGSADSRFLAGGRRPPSKPVRNALYTPLRDFFGRLLGVVEVLDKPGGPFGPEDVSVIEMFGRYVAVSLQAVLRESPTSSSVEQVALVQQLQRTEMVRNIEAAFTESDDMRAILSRVLRRISEALGAEWGAAVLVDEENTECFLGYTSTETPEALRRLAASPTDGLALLAMDQRKPVFSNAPGQDARLSPAVSRQLAGMRGIASAPLLAGENLLGVVTVGDHWGPGFAAIDLALLEFLATHTAVALKKRLLLEQARGAQRLAAVGAVAARIVHDIKQPISTLKLIAYDLKQGDVAGPRQLIHARLMESSLKYLMTLTQEVLDFSRGEMSYDLEEMVLSDLLGEPVEAIRRECTGKKPIEFLAQIVDGARVNVDKARFQRVVLNIATNAIEAMGPGGRLTLETELEEDGVLLKLIDDGPGIPAEIQERLFRPFVTFGKSQGTGLGLAICKTIVEAHGGRISAMNNAARGACFSIWLPTLRPQG